MSQPIKSNQFSHGAGKGDEPRPVDRAKYRSQFDAIRWSGAPKGRLAKKKDGRTTYVY
jgi:hypothetical protein